MFKQLSIGVLLTAILCCPSQASDAPLLLDYQREFSMLEEADNSVDIKIFSDGTVQVHYPLFMRRAGDYRYQLNSDELDNILQSLRQLGVDEFNAAATRQALAQQQALALEAAQTGGGSMRIVTDPETTRVRIATSLIASVDVSEHAFSFSGVRHQAEIYPQITALGELASALNILDILATDQRMQRIEVTP